MSTGSRITDAELPPEVQAILPERESHVLTHAAVTRRKSKSNVGRSDRTNLHALCERGERITDGNEFLRDEAFEAGGLDRAHDGWIE